jgi:hypothetical protein
MHTKMRASSNATVLYCIVEYCAWLFVVLVVGGYHRIANRFVSQRKCRLVRMIHSSMCRLVSVVYVHVEIIMYHYSMKYLKSFPLPLLDRHLPVGYIGTG